MKNAELMHFPGGYECMVRKQKKNLKPYQNLKINKFLLSEELVKKMVA
jgi:hypothetical protein